MLGSLGRHLAGVGPAARRRWGRKIADELHINHATLDNWKKKYPEFLGALKAGKDASDDRVERSLYQLAIGWNGQPPNTTAAIFWLKNHRPDRWRDVQQIAGDIGHYIISDRPMTEEQWITERAKVIEAKPEPSATRAQHVSETPEDKET